MTQVDAIQHRDHPQGGEFFIEHEGRRVAEMTYRRPAPDRILVDHTYVDPLLRGGGVARRLLDAMAAWTRHSGLRIQATCSYVVVQLARDASLADLRANQVRSER